MLKPPEMMTSLRRSSSVRKPSASKRPMSPVRMKRLPSASNHSASRVASGWLVVAGHHAGRMPTTSPASPAPLRTPASSISRMSWPRRRRADGVQLVGMQVGLGDAGAAAFGHAVRTRSAPRPAPQHFGLQRGCERRAGRELSRSEARQVVAVELGPREQRSYCTGTSIACVTRFAPQPASSRWCLRVELRPSAARCRHGASVGKNTTSVVFEYSGVASSVTVSGRIH